MLSDYFRPAMRATVLAIYSSGIYIGAGIGIFLGGWIVGSWESAYPDPSLAPLGLKGWQAAYVAVGLPGLVMAVWVATLREPVRGLSEGLVTPEHPHPFRTTFQELMAVLPPFTVWTLARPESRLAGNCTQPARGGGDRPRRVGVDRTDLGSRTVDCARHRHLRGVLLGPGVGASGSGGVRDDVQMPGVRLRSRGISHHRAGRLRVRRLGAAVLHPGLRHQPDGSGARAGLVLRPLAVGSARHWAASSPTG